MWVENLRILAYWLLHRSSSLWGCELKNREKQQAYRNQSHPPCEDVSWKTKFTRRYHKRSVILLVRMWVENNGYGQVADTGATSSSLWGCELKKYFHQRKTTWNLSSSLWGCELKRTWEKRKKIAYSHPPCEDVSWKTGGMSMNPYMSCHPPCEDVSWKENDVKMYGTHV